MAIFRVCARCMSAYNAALPEIRTPPSSRASARRVQGRCTSIGWVGLKISMFYRVKVKFSRLQERYVYATAHIGAARAVALDSRSAIRSQSQGWRIDICSTCPQLCGHVRQRSVALHARACRWVKIAPFFSWRLALNAERRSAV